MEPNLHFINKFINLNQGVLPVFFLYAGETEVRIRYQFNINIISGPQILWAKVDLIMSDIHEN